MNKSKFIAELQKKLNIDEQKAIVINSVLEDHFLIGKNNKEKIIQDFMTKLNIDNNEANNIYNIVMSIIGGSIKDRLKHPFKSQKEDK
ncbi:MAG: hypothetical protein IKN87_02020 [Bacilli bacterium]|nr:hypothetical protein [Bacilli bacterium]